MLTLMPQRCILQYVNRHLLGLRHQSGRVFCFGANMSEEITQHIITKGGEFMSRRIGIMDDFNPKGYMANVTNIPPYDLIQATDDTYVSFDSVLKLWFTRTEVH